ncbi:lipid A export permease/ATP-binding protein MsbA [Limnohabitans sp. 103DPR2]|uniref:lipid A export permease/ATP-binding protein MsbA n=1 Tax=Limnohabitans sp. 103DPR2 TaxID=1678129 RepID=UPI0006DCEFDA|nr:lipid A export permease/ATP-binding protein MsbA [Limnohabitans sp. 103DPR2]ALK92116.1 Lipid A export ATP-binding/permease protein MsbA [Limnohabitans sp. 103DPR2]
MTQAATETASKEISFLKRMLRLWPFFGQQRAVWFLAITATVVAACTEPLIPALFKPLLDEGFSEKSLPLWWVPIAVIGIFLIRGLAFFVSQYALARIANDGMQALREALFQRLIQAEMSIFGKQSASTLSNTLVYEVQNGATQLISALLGLSRDGFTLLALIAYLMFLNWKLTFVVFVVVPGSAWIMKKLSKRLYGLTRDSQAATDELAYVVEENVLAHRIIRLHGAQNSQTSRFQILSQRLRSLALKSTIASAAMSPLTQLMAAVALSSVLVIALIQSRSGLQGATVGGFVAFITAMLMLVSPIKRLADIATPITRGLAALERGLQLLEEVAVESESADETNAGQASTQKAFNAASQPIEFENVTVQYPGDAPAALLNFNLKINAGETIAFVGPSGSGKTTLVNLLPKFVLPSQGQIKLSGVDIASWPLTALRSQFAMVSQDVVMLNDTVGANIALGQEIDKQRVMACLKAANLSEHIERLPSGIDTVLGHNATQLSGGQRQRLAIARALYKDAPILILDEATSALDNESERLVQEALHNLMKGRTTLIIAHRLSTIEHADRVVVMAQGEIVEQGRHADLINSGGAYSRLQRKGDMGSSPNETH